LADILKLLQNRTNQAILCLLAAEPSYVRRTAALLGLSESEVTRRLRAMERTGLVASEWSHIGRNVKMYRPATETVHVSFAPDGVRIGLGGGREPARVVVDPHPVVVPPAGHVAGREAERAVLAEAPVAVVHGLPGIGKTALVAAHAAAQSAPVFWHAFRGVESLGWLVNRLGVFYARLGDSSVLAAAEGGLAPADQRALLLQAVVRAEALLVFDDVHSIDEPRLREWIDDAIRCEAAARIVVVGRRPWPVPPGHGRIRVLALAGLARPAIVEMLGQHGVEAGDHVLRMAEDALGGHPLALRLAVEAAQRTGRPLEAVLEGLPAEGLDAYLMEEVDAHLSPGERLCLAGASLFEAGFTMADLRAVQPKARRGDVLRLQRHGFLEPRGAAHALHEIVRTHFRARLDDSRVFHARAARHFVGLGTLEGHLAALHHHLEAGERDEAMRLLERNLDLHEFRLIDAGYARIYARLLRVLDDADLPPRLRAIIEDEKGDLCFAEGDAAGACRHYEAAYAYFEAHPEGWEDEDLAWKRAMALDALGRRGEALEVVRNALPGAPPGRARVRLEALLETLLEPRKGSPEG